MKPDSRAGTVEVAPAPAQPVPWYQGTFKEQNAQGLLELKVDAEGLVTGRFLRGKEVTHAAGLVELPEGDLRLRLLGPRIFGSLVAARSGSAWEGTLRASDAMALDLESEPTVLGQKWEVHLSRVDERPHQAQP